MIENLLEVDQLRSLARRRSQREIFSTVRTSSIQNGLDAGWRIIRQNRSTTRLAKSKTMERLLIDRMWTICYRLGFRFLPNEDGVVIRDRKGEIHLELLAVDEEVALVVLCRAPDQPKRYAGLLNDCLSLAEIRKRLTSELKRFDNTGRKRHVGVAILHENLILSERDLSTAKAHGIILLDEAELAYYEALEQQLGQAARYQLLSDILPGKMIEGLSLTLPAVKARMGGYDCYTFAISPEYLLKISYISHRAKGKTSDVNAYQRMIKKSRLRNIRTYISEDGIFPTNIVLNIDSKYVQFDRAKQEGDPGATVFGWLQLRPAYKVAWVIDGQHRLFAYSGHPRASSSVLSVIAFSGLPPSEQARLFVDINAEQRRVKQNLLYELDAELHWNAEDPEQRSRAVISKAVQVLDSDLDSPFRGRILREDADRSDVRCISLAAMVRSLSKSGFFYTKSKGRSDAGPLVAKDNDATLRRTVEVFKVWFEEIASEVSEVWNVGAGAGGGLAMSDGTSICINVLRSILPFLEEKHGALGSLPTHELVSLLRPYGRVLGRHFATKTPQQMVQFRALRGNEGQAAGTRQGQLALKRDYPDFDPPGLTDFIEAERRQTSERARAIILEVESVLHKWIIQELRREYSGNEESWWFDGVPIKTRKKIDDRRNEDQGKKGGRAENFDFIDYREVIRHNWSIFGDIFGMGKGGKDTGGKDN